jgi:hypothetical protein
MVTVKRDKQNLKTIHLFCPRNLWNNLLQPEGSRTQDYRLVGPLICPSPQSPYLALQGPSATYSAPLPTYVP